VLAQEAARCHNPCFCRVALPVLKAIHTRVTALCALIALVVVLSLPQLVHALGHGLYVPVPEDHFTWMLRLFAPVFVVAGEQAHSVVGTTSVTVLRARAGRAEAAPLSYLHVHLQDRLACMLHC
jgi:hypothetical protein